MNLQHTMDNPKIAAVVSAVTTGTGVGTWLDYIPDDIGKLATVTGIVLSSVLIYTHLRKSNHEAARARLELAILEEKEAERLENARRRKAEGLPIRREEDTVV